MNLEWRPDFAAVIARPQSHANQLGRALPFHADTKTLSENRLGRVTEQQWWALNKSTVVHGTIAIVSIVLALFCIGMSNDLGTHLVASAIVFGSLKLIYEGRLGVFDLNDRHCEPVTGTLEIAQRGTPDGLAHIVTIAGHRYEVDDPQLMTLAPMVHHLVRGYRTTGGKVLVNVEASPIAAADVRRGDNGPALLQIANPITLTAPASGLSPVLISGQATAPLEDVIPDGGRLVVDRSDGTRRSVDVIRWERDGVHLVSRTEYDGDNVVLTLRPFEAPLYFPVQIEQGQQWAWRGHGQKIIDNHIVPVMLQQHFQIIGRTQLTDGRDVIAVKVMDWLGIGDEEPKHTATSLRFIDAARNRVAVEASL